MLCEQCLMNFEHAGAVLEGNDLESPIISPHSNDSLFSQVFRPVDAEARLSLSKSLVILTDQAEPAGMEKYHVAFLNFHVLGFRGSEDLFAIETLSLGQHALAEVLSHVQ